MEIQHQLDFEERDLSQLDSHLCQLRNFNRNLDFQSLSNFRELVESVKSKLESLGSVARSQNSPSRNTERGPLASHVHSKKKQLCSTDKKVNRQNKVKDTPTKVRNGDNLELSTSKLNVGVKNSPEKPCKALQKIKRIDQIQGVSALPITFEASTMD